LCYDTLVYSTYGVYSTPGYTGIFIGVACHVPSKIAETVLRGPLTYRPNALECTKSYIKFLTNFLKVITLDTHPLEALLTDPREAKNWNGKER